MTIKESVTPEDQIRRCRQRRAAHDDGCGRIMRLRRWRRRLTHGRRVTIGGAPSAQLPCRDRLRRRRLHRLRQRCAPLTNRCNSSRAIRACSAASTTGSLGTIAPCASLRAAASYARGSACAPHRRRTLPTRAWPSPAHRSGLWYQPRA